MLAGRFNPRRIVLFGSYANGQAREDSDVDMLVTMDHGDSSLRTAAQIIRELRPRFAVDLIVRTEDELAERLAQDDSFLRAATENGQVIYEATE